MLGKLRMRYMSNTLLDYFHSHMEVPQGFMVLDRGGSAIDGVYLNCYDFLLYRINHEANTRTYKLICWHKVENRLRTWLIMETYCFKTKLSSKGYDIVDIHTGEYNYTKEII